LFYFIIVQITTILSNTNVGLSMEEIEDLFCKGKKTIYHLMNV